MKWVVRCINPTFTFVATRNWIRTARGIEQKAGTLHLDINEAYHHAGASCHCSTCYYVVDEEP